MFYGVILSAYVHGEDFVCSEYLIFIFLRREDLRASSYPIVEPQTEGYLQVAQLHKLHYAVYGNPNGIPVIILHGGRGVGFKIPRFY